MTTNQKEVKIFFTRICVDTLSQLRAENILIRNVLLTTRKMLKQIHQDILTIYFLECRLNERISSDCFQIPGYNPRLDRIDRMGRCVAFFTIDSLVVRQRIDLEIDGFGFCGLNFQLNNGNFFVVCAIGLLIMMLLHCLFFSKNFN